MKSKLTYKELEKKIAELERNILQYENTENQYRYLVDSTTDSLYLVDEKCRYIFMNNNHIQRLKLPIEKIIGHSYNEFHSAEQSKEFAEKVNEVYTTNKSVQDEHQSPRSGYFLRTFSPVRDSVNNGKIIAVVIVSKNITERRLAEEALRKSEEKYRLLIENSNDAIFIIMDGKIKYANLHTAQMTGYDIKDLSSISFINLVIAEDRDMVLELQESCLQGENPSINYSFRITNKQGITLWVETNSVGMNWDNEPAILNSMRNITKQKRTEARLFQAQKMESIGTLAGGIAHDFNNLLMGIQGHASLALLHIDPQNANFEHLKTIETLVTSGADLTKQLLGFARGGKYEVKTVDLNLLIQKTSETIGRTKKEIKIHRNFQTDLWPVDVDHGQIEQVLLNLYVNAWQAMPGGGNLYLETKNVFIEESHFKPYVTMNGHYVKISVTDTGVGMDEKTKERIFEPFFTTREMGRGTGLGLASVYGIIKNHNGFINVYSEKGQGTTFNIYLPASSKKNTHDKDKGVDRDNLIPKGAETILLVDDEPMILTVGSELLKTLGYTILTAQDGSSAIDLYKNSKDNIDLVILDMVMPEMSGGELFDELKKINPQVKVLLSSGYSLNGQASRIIKRGCVGFIQKPFTIRDIASQLRKIIDEQKTATK
ncbi:MAG: PAS domain S-box protein [Smithellaceae bacterium]|jgi:PAS domain S-box-containing protein